MPEDFKKDFYNLVDLTMEFRRRFAKTENFDDIRCWSVAAQIAQAQQLSIISSRLAGIEKALNRVCDARPAVSDADSKA